MLDQNTLNDYFGLKNMKPTEYLAKLAEKETVRPWVSKILALGTFPPWVASRVKIFRSTLNFEAKRW